MLSRKFVDVTYLFFFYSNNGAVYSKAKLKTFKFYCFSLTSGKETFNSNLILSGNRDLILFLCETELKMVE
jgi:hypothetical protein